jgi:hypothetical protein
MVYTTNIAYPYFREVAAEKGPLARRCDLASLIGRGQGVGGVGWDAKYLLVPLALIRASQ